ncbi:M23 family metallopeptidase [Gilvibacter sp.]|uniref:M23 family metallopeptidase n=1 Tax=Gilvibacter sp. TaxID=2729997 RepID=UPI0035BE291D
MYQKLLSLGLCCALMACSKRDPVRELPNQIPDFEQTSCADAQYPEWSTSLYVLPYPVGKSYNVGLSHCGGSFHSEGEPDQFAVDFDMMIGTLITAARPGRVIYVEESGMDGNFPNNLVVVQHDDNTYAHYMHLTFEGAIVEVNYMVNQGDEIGYSGSTGLAGYPHLHFVVTVGGWTYPYVSVPYNFRNTEPNPKSLTSGVSYLAEPY